MTQYLWFLSAMTAAVLWGLGYIISEKIMKSGISISFYMFFTSVFGVMAYGITCFCYGFKNNFNLLIASPKLLTMIIVCSLSFVVANFCIFYSVASKNATIASLIEISYPVFTFLFALLLFKEVQINVMGGIGTVLIFAGIICVFLGSK